MSKTNKRLFKARRNMDEFRTRKETPRTKYSRTNYRINPRELEEEAN